jgi:archaemetzincin
MEEIIKIVPIISPPEFILKEIQKNLQNIFSMKTEINDLIFPNDICKNYLRNQYYASKLLKLMRDLKIDDAKKIIGVINEDIYDEGYNFLFGSAELGGKYGVVSIYRLYDKDINKFIERCVKEAVHEVGHLFGLSHCNNKNCVMNFSLSILNVDRKDKFFCKICEMKLKKLK